MRSHEDRQAQWEGKNVYILVFSKVATAMLFYAIVFCYISLYSC